LNNIVRDLGCTDGRVVTYHMTVLMVNRLQLGSGLSDDDWT